MKIEYIPMHFQRKIQDHILKADKIIQQYNALGLTLTLRQIYYKFVGHGWIVNDKEGRNYTNLGNTLNKARLAGWIDWEAMEDRSRSLYKQASWDQPKDIIESVVQAYHRDLWLTQKEYVEVWVEKDALSNLVERACSVLDVPYFACKGYTSVSELHNAALRIMNKRRPATIIHLGDHDPSGIDMTRDIFERLEIFFNYHEYKACNVERIALNMDQIEKYKCIPAPVSIKQSIAKKYIAAFGDNCWELDALEPMVLIDLIKEKIKRHLDQKLFDIELEKQNFLRHVLHDIADNFEEIKGYLGQAYRGAW